MSDGEWDFNRGAVKPLQCLREGWGLVKEDYWLFLGISVVGILVGSMVPFGILIGTAMCGIYLCLLRRERGLPISFDMLFKGFDYFVPSLVATLIMVFLSVFVVGVVGALFVIAVVFTLTGIQRPQGGPPDAEQLWPILAAGVAGFTLIMIFSIVMGALFVFTFPLIVDRRMSGTEAVQMSFRAALGNFRGVLGLMLLNTLMSLAGVLACYIGAFFVMPIGLAMIAIAYRQVFPARDSLDYLSAEPEPGNSARPVDSRFRVDES